MIVIESSNFKKYKYAVAKLIFLEVYKNKYQFYKDIPFSNLMLMKSKTEIIYVSLLGNPKMNLEFNYKCIIFYQTNRNYSKENSEKLNHEFDKKYKSILIKAVISPNFLQNYKMFNILFKYFILENNEIIDNNMYKKNQEVLYKYYSEDIRDYDKYEKKEGKIAFLPPSKMNDPFDCNCVFDVGSKADDLFKLFCTSPVKDNILMWSHYGSNHKGYCFEYSKFDIFNKILKENIDGILIIGNVNYYRKRKKHIIKSKKLSFTNLKEYVDAAFSKYEIWNYEREFRFVIVSENNQDIYNIQVEINNVYAGCNADHNELYNSAGKPLNVKFAKKNDVDYKIDL